MKVCGKGDIFNNRVDRRHSMDNSQQSVQRARDFGLPDYFDMQAAMGHTKHVGGWIAT